MTRSTPGSGSEDCYKTTLGMKNNCYINVKVLYENVRVRVHVCVRLYPPFPTTPKTHPYHYLMTHISDISIHTQFILG